MATIAEIAPDIFRISIYVPAANLQFNHFVLRDDEPLLFHTGLRGMHAEIREAVAKVVPVSSLRHISFSHFESDECGEALRERVEALRGDARSPVGAGHREARAMGDGEVLSTGKYKLRYCATPHLPHGWDAGLLFEETNGTLLCSDLFHQEGDVEPVTETDVVGRSHQAMLNYQAGVLADYVPYTPLTSRNLRKLAALKPRTLAIMHGSSYRGDCARALGELDRAYKEVFGGERGGA